MQASAATVEAYGEFLAGCYAWDYFGTTTLDNAHSKVGERIFAGQMHRFFWRWFHLAAVRAGGAEVVTIAGKERYVGPLAKAYKRKRGRFVYVFAIEPHRSRQLHAHFLLYVPRYFERLDYHDGHNAWAWGWTDFQPPKSQGDVAAYVSKYMAKGGELNIAESFESDRLRMATAAGVKVA